MVRLAMVWPAAWFRFDTVGLVGSVGDTVTKPLLLGEVAVTLATTAPTLSTGMPPTLTVWRPTSKPGSTGALSGTPTWLRVSRIRWGATGTRAPAFAAVPLG